MSPSKPARPASDAKEGWGSRLGVILAVAGSAVGLGNFLRFPGQAVQNGGGAFMVPYFLALVLVGIPIGWMEWTLARYGGRKGFHSAPGILGVAGRGRVARYLGVLGVLIPVVIAMYYVLIESWCLRYFVDYARGAIDLGSDPVHYIDNSRAFFTRITGADDDGLLRKDGTLHGSVVFWLITLLVNLVFVWRGLSKGIELFCRLAMPVMAVAAVIVLVRVLTLGTPDPLHPERNVVAGLGFMWNPDFSKLRLFDTWLAAAGQIFFSLSVGFGVIINYASYLRKEDDVILSGLTAAATNEVFEVGFGGLITITAAFIFLGASGATGSSFGIGFNTLPVVFEHMGAAGRVTGAVWFFMLFLAAITSSLSMLQPAIAFLHEALGMPRPRAVLWLGLLVFTGSLWVIYYSKDLKALDTMDFWVGTFLIFVMAGVQAVIFSWVMGVDRGMAEAHLGAQIRIPRVFRYVFRYVTPAFLLVIFIGFSVQSLPASVKAVLSSAVAAKTTLFVLGIAALLAALVRVGERKWRHEGLDLDGRLSADEEAR
ncbi:MAG: sodium-dependent transporter [Myxococcales bacterium]|nr:sodium-dependent transporter [Myxococcales bacterium]